LMGTNFVDGEITTLPRPIGLANALLGGVVTSVSYVGPSPGSISALVQVNVFVSNNAPVGAAVPVVLVLNAVQTRQRVTVAIR
jgi:uncharacterized protein (TIGR03437 family)